MLKGQKIKLDHCFTVQQAETVINLVKQGNGIGILSELVLNATPNNLYRHTISPEVEMAIGIIANDLSDLTPVASTLAYMVREECESYADGHKKKKRLTETNNLHQPYFYNLRTKSNDIHPIPLFSLPHPAELSLPLRTSIIVYTPIGIN